MKNSKSPYLIAGFLIIMGFFSTFCLEAGQVYQLTFTSRYIWRGFDMNPPNKPVLQPSITFDFGKSGIALNLWGSFSFENKQVNETDLTLSYTFKTPESYSLSVGFTHYGWYFAKPFKLKNNTSQEVYISAGLPKAFLNPKVTVYYDFNNGDGTYVVLALAHSLKLSEKLVTDLSASLGYNGRQWINQSGFSDLNFGAAVPFNLDKVTISPFINITFILMDAVNPGIDNELTIGASLWF